MALHKKVGVSVLAFGYRGYGRSEGKPTVEGILDDARAARAWLATREKIRPRNVVLMGALAVFVRGKVLTGHGK
jgi:alpha/beta superfamily hydrolase